MLWWLAQNGLAAAVLTALVALVCRLVRFGPAVRHALWLIVLLKLLTPPLVVWPWALPELRQESATEAVAAAPATAKADSLPPVVNAEAILASEELFPREAFALAPLGPVDRDEETSINNPAVAAGSIHTDWLSPLLQNLWLAGTVLMCLLQIIRIARFQRLLSQSNPALPWLDHLVAEVARRIGVHRPPTLIVPGISSPFVWSLGRPKLLWPLSLVGRLPHDYHRSVLAHELSHLRRRDHWIGWLQLIAECLWWWNPLFWYVRRQLRLNAELACDAWVVATLPDDRRAYAEALIRVTELLSQTAAPLPALGIQSAARQDFERRLTMIMRDRVPCRAPLLGLLAIGVLALVCLPGWSQPEVQVQKLPVDKEVSGPDKRIIVVDKEVSGSDKPIIITGSSDVEWQAKPIIGVVQKTVGDKQVNIDVDVDVKGKAGSTSERDRRLDRLEAQLQELLKEVKALRGGDAKLQNRFPETWKTSPPSKAVEPSDRPRVKVIETKPGEVKHAPPDKGAPEAKVSPWYYEYQDTKRGKFEKGRADVVTLTRATYRLPHATAELLASLLPQHKHEVEAQVDGDILTITTTTPEAQRAIGEFIGFLQGSGAADRPPAKVR